MFDSGNWNERSMRLNFEFHVETYDRGLAARLDDSVAGVIARSRRRTLAEMDARSLPVRLEDGIARLLSPYLRRRSPGTASDDETATKPVP